jgi:hypothetical protein
MLDGEGGASLQGCVCERERERELKSELLLLWVLIEMEGSETKSTMCRAGSTEALLPLLPDYLLVYAGVFAAILYIL